MYRWRSIGVPLVGRAALILFVCPTQAVQPYYEKIFDSISMVVHDREDVSIIREFVNREGTAEERIGLFTAVKAVGNIEDWLSELLLEMQRTMKLLCEECVFDTQVCVHAQRHEARLRGS